MPLKRADDTEISWPDQQPARVTRRGSPRLCAQPATRAALAAGLDALVPEAVGVSSAEEALRLLRADPDLAWQCYAMASLADELAGGG